MDRYGFGSWREALPVVWELIPYSFLVDYFSNIGQIIDSYSTQLGGVMWINGTVRVEREIKLNSLALDADAMKAAFQGTVGAFRYELSGSGGEYGGYVNRCVRFDRTPWSAQGLLLSLADIQIKVPGVGSSKWLNIAALARLRH